MQLVYTEDDPKKGNAPNKGGRPRKLLPDENTLNAVRGMAQIFCTLAEAGKVLGVTEKTFIEFLNTFTAAREAWDTGQASGRVSLRRQQVAMAKDNVAMAIFLGKNYLGQSDKQTHEHRHAIVPIDETADQSQAAQRYAEVMNLPPALRLIAPRQEIELDAQDVTEINDDAIQDADAEMKPPGNDPED